MDSDSDSDSGGRDGERAPLLGDSSLTVHDVPSRGTRSEVLPKTRPSGGDDGGDNDDDLIDLTSSASQPDVLLAPQASTSSAGGSSTIAATPSRSPSPPPKGSSSPSPAGGTRLLPASSPPPPPIWTLAGVRARVGATPRRTALFVAAAMFALNATGTAGSVPVLRLAEDVICRRYYGRLEAAPMPPGGDLDEAHCKADEIQAQLAWLIGGMVAVMSAVGFVCALPYGTLADKIGRKPVFLLSYLGEVLGFLWLITVLRFPRIFPIELLLLTPLLHLIGGGTSVMVGTVFSMLADVTPEADRASTFFLIAFASAISGIGGLLLAATLMEINPWIPMVLALVMSPFTLSIAVILPETLPAELRAETARAHLPHRHAPTRLRLAAHVRSGFVEMGKALRLLRNPGLVLILSNFFIQASFLVGDTSILVQYLSKRFHWELSRAAMMLAACAAVNVVCLVFLPTASSLLVHPPARLSRIALSPFGKDRALAIFSTLVAAGAAVCMGNADLSVVVGGMLFGALGSGWGSLTRAMATAYVSKEYNSRLSGLISLTGTVGGVVAGPTMAWLFETGMRRKGPWFGLPYFYMAGLALVAGFALCFVRPPPDQKARDEEEQGVVAEQQESLNR